MCIIIIKDNNKTINDDVLSMSARINKDGLGIVWLDTYDIEYHKSTKWKVLQTDRPFIAHFRYATIGKVCLENTHPFKCGDTDEYMMMNGTIGGLGNYKDCDTKVLANMMADVNRDSWEDELSRHTNVRFVTFNTKKKKYQVYNKSLWTINDGTWYSKDYVLQNTYVAVYGTLKRGQGNYARFLYDSTFVGSGKTMDKYPLIIKGLPYLIDNIGKGYNVNVDVFKVDDSTLYNLDKLEGHPNFYRRKQIPISVNGMNLICWVYFNMTNKVSPTDILYPSYGSVPQRTKHIGTSKVYEINSEIVPYCIGCLSNLYNDIFNEYTCENCGESYTESEIATLFH